MADRVDGAVASRVGRTLAISLALLLALLAATVYVAWPDNVLTGPGQHTIGSSLQSYLPQGWAFFTRSPEAPALVPYRANSSGQWERIDTLPQSSLRNLFGLSRNQRAQSTELALVADSVKRWTKCDNYLGTCLRMSAKAAPTSLRNPDDHPFFCGSMTLVLQTPVKWAYRNDTTQTDRVSQFAVLDLNCYK